MTKVNPMLQPEYPRAVQIVIYDLQGGPFPEKAAEQLERDVQKVAESFDGLAITVVRE